MHRATTIERLLDVCALADVNTPQRLEFEADPALAVELLEYALSRPKIRNPAAFAVTRFRRELGRRARVEELNRPDDPDAPTLSSLELAWSLELPDVAIAALGREIEAHGGLAALR